MTDAHCEFFQRCFDYEVWEAWEPLENLPHVMFIMAFEQKMQSENQPLLKGECLQIIAAMITRVQLPALQEHKVFPVSRLNPNFFHYCTEFSLADTI
jgi:hypothetical protein